MRRRPAAATDLLESAFHVPYFRPVRRQHGAGLLCRALVQRAGAAAWPDKPITFVAPFTAGGANDLVARIIAKAVGAALNQPVIVENRPAPAA